MSRTNTKELWLIWQDSKTRLRHIVGKLWIKKGKYYFAYNKDGLKSSAKQGFQLHPAFPHYRVVYKSENLFPAFAMRLPNKDRPDYIQILKKYDLNPDDSDFDILTATGGRLATDNYEFVPAFYGCDNYQLNHEFFVAGWRYWEGPTLSEGELVPGNRLLIEPEPENEYDKFALQVKTNDGVKIGYIPVFYSKIIYHYIAKGCNCDLEIVNFDPNKESQEILKVKLICDGNCK